MKEQFVEREFQAKTLAIIDKANEIIDEYQEQGFTLTLRQLYYQFVARDLDKYNNRWKNLREAKGKNACNVARYSNNTSGIKGVCWHEAAGKWVARVQASGIMHHLGVFDSKKTARIAYLDAAKRLHGEFARAA